MRTVFPKELITKLKDEERLLLSHSLLIIVKETLYYLYQLIKQMKFVMFLVLMFLLLGSESFIFPNKSLMVSYYPRNNLQKGSKNTISPTDHHRQSKVG